VLLANDPETAVLRVVKDDPFASIGEIRDRLQEVPGWGDLGWWRIFGILRRRKLLKRRSRFRFARGRK
jgi:hypothetical protein